MRLLLSALVLVVAIAGPGLAASNAVRGTASAASHPARVVLSDPQIERNIRAKLLKSKINADHFTVKVTSGVALLEGKTGVIQHKGVATRLARSGGAAAVENHIQISEEARARAAAKLAKYREGGQIAKATVISAPKTR